MLTSFLSAGTWKVEFGSKFESARGARSALVGGASKRKRAANAAASEEILYGCMVSDIER